MIRQGIRFPSRRSTEQERIVAILDKFDALVNDLSIGLPAELDARRKQYEHYRDRLLTFEEARHERGAGGASLRADRRRRREHRRRRVRPGRLERRRRTRPRPSSKRRSSSCCRARRTSTCRSRARPTLVANLRAQLEALNAIEFTRRRVGAVLHREDRGRERGHRREDGADPGGPRPGPQARRRHDQERHADRQAEHPQQPAAGDQPVRGRPATAPSARNRYDVTVLVNGLPLVHVELKRRGVDIREAFNQINRYQRDSFWAGSGLFEYVQLFVISNGTLTKYYSNTTRDSHVAEQAGGRSRRQDVEHASSSRRWWADATNRPIADLTGFTKTFFAKHTLLNILTRYCVFDADRKLLVMRPYQIVGDRADPAADRDLDQLQAARHDRGRRLRLAHHRLGQDADELQGRPAREPAAGRRQGAVRRRPQGPRLPDDARVRPVREGRRQLEHVDERPQAAAGGPGRADHHHDDPEARPLRRRRTRATRSTTATSC